MTPLAILHLDDHLAIVDKPSGMLVHAGWARDGELAMTTLRDQLGRYVYPVHRIDRGTSGVLAFALDAETARLLHEDFESGRVIKEYLALVRGVPPERGVIDHPIPRREGGPRVSAVTEYRRLGTFEQCSLVEAVPQTGRLHQVRRHLKHLGHPVIGDANYGKGALNRQFCERFGLCRLALHARALRLAHPVTRALLEIRAPLPADLRGPLSAMGIEDRVE